MQSQTSDELVEGLLRSLREAGARYAESSSLQSDIGADYRIQTKFGDTDICLIVEAKLSVFPRDAREAAWRIRECTRADNMLVPMIAADTISPGARDFLKENRIGYYDSSGSVYVPAHGVFVLIDRPPEKRQARALGNIFIGSRARALHAIWQTHGEWFGVQQIADKAAVSPATASETLTALERREWVSARGSGPSKERRLSKPTELLDAWVSHNTNAARPNVKRYYVRTPSVSELCHDLDAACESLGIHYEVTGNVAGNWYAPHLSSISQLICRVAGPDAAEMVKGEMGASQVNEGWNFGIIAVQSDKDLVFRERVNDLWLAPPLQTYLDLLQSGGRSKELAQHLRSERLQA